MAGFYEDLAGIASGVLKEFKQGTIRLVVETEVPGDTSFEPDDPIVQTLVLDAVAEGPERKYVNGTTITFSSKQITVSPVAVDETTGATVTITRDMLKKGGTSVTIDGDSKAIKEVEQVPAAGLAVIWLIFVDG